MWVTQVEMAWEWVCWSLLAQNTQSRLQGTDPTPAPGHKLLCYLVCSPAAAICSDCTCYPVH